MQVRAGGGRGYRNRMLLSQILFRPGGNWIRVPVIFFPNCARKPDPVLPFDLRGICERACRARSCRCRQDGWLPEAVRVNGAGCPYHCWYRASIHQVSLRAGEWLLRFTLRKPHLVDVSVTEDPGREPGGESIDHRYTDTVETPGDLVGLPYQICRRMQDREHDFKGTLAVLLHRYRRGFPARYHQR